jgi:hypothetical protein
MVAGASRWGRCLLSVLLGATALAAQSAAALTQDVFLEAELQPKQVYVQAQAVYQLRFYHAVDVRELKMTGPTVRLAELRPIGDERVFEALRDGRRYRVHERRYALVPLASGALALAGASVQGRVPAPAGGAADGRMAMRLEAPAQTLTVLPVPAAAGAGPWLPAAALALSESWSLPPGGISPGQLLQRTIRIEADGVDASQIPPLTLQAPGLQVLAEPPRLENRLDGERLTGVREQRFQLVALRAGTLDVPALQLSWWNLRADALAAATLPARTLQVAAVATEVDAEPPADRPLNAASALTRPSTPESTWSLAPWWPRLLLASAVLLSVGLGAAYARRPGVRAAWRLQRACRARHAGAVRDALLAWAALSWPAQPPLTLEALAECGADPALRQALGLLERSLYGPPADPPAAAALRAALRTIQRGRGGWLRSRPQTSSP